MLSGRKIWQKRALIAVLSVCAMFVIALTVSFLVFMYVPARLNVTNMFKRANAGDPMSQRVVGYWYLTGTVKDPFLWNVPQDNKKALYWSGLAARADNHEAYFDYAQALENDGQMQQAKPWYIKSAHTGNLDAERKLKSLTNGNH